VVGGFVTKLENLIQNNDALKHFLTKLRLIKGCPWKTPGFRGKG